MRDRQRDPAELPREPALELQGLSLAVVLALVLALPGVAAAQTAGSLPPGSGARAVSPGVPVEGRDSHPREVLAAAEAHPRVARELRRHGEWVPSVYVDENDTWKVSFHAAGTEVAQVYLRDDGPEITEAWTGIQADWTMARGYEGAFGRRAAALPVWLILLGALALPFLRPPWRLLHLDLAVLASFSISVAFFHDGNIDASVPLAYPPLLYLLVRLVLLARRRAEPRPLRLLLGPDALLMGILFLLGLRIGLQATSSNVIDVGYAGIIGADRIAHGDALYGAFPPDNPRGDTYGPLLYLAYIPFELLWPWDGVWDDLPAGHVAAATFDLLCAAGLYLAGRRLRGHLTGLLLAYVWLACPLTLYAANSGANDPLVGALVLLAVTLVAAPAARGAVIATAALTKFAPLGLFPLLVRSPRAIAAAAAITAAGLGLILALDGGFGEFWDRTIGFQADRDSPFSVWGLYDLGALQLVAQAAAVGLVLFLAARGLRDPLPLASAAAASLIAVQLGVEHWFYLYIVWFLPVALVALIGPYVPLSGRSTGSIDAARPD